MAWRRLSAALAATLLCVAVPARADKETIALTYDAGAGCPDKKQFVFRVHTFTSKAEIANDDDAALHRTFAVQVLRSGNTVRGELTIDDRGAKTTRHVSGATCDEVISALALATAIAVDPDALGGSTPDATEPPTASEPPAPAAKPAPTPDAAGTRARPKRPAPVAPPGPPALYLSAGARVGDAIAPFPKFEAVAELGCTYFAPFEFQVGAAYGPPQHDAQFRLDEWLGWLGTGYRLFELEPLSVLALAAVEAGEVRAGGGPDVTPSHALHTAWLAVDVGLAARRDGPGPLFFQANVGARAPVLLQRYVETESRGAVELFQVKQLGYLLSLSVGIHFL
ncbi:MAG TPA: hypothetical protein VNW92_31830 [Polyangiaceae bacterium]|jgi:hypothetical protein|nr:hypothetical protein [Polyangiaceae bacterium]